MTPPVYSGRQDWQSTVNRLSKSLTATGDCLDLTVSNPTKVGLPSPSLSAWQGDRLAHYAPAALGLPSARAAVADYYMERGRTVSPDQVVLCASTSEAYSWLFKLLCDPGCSVLCPQPSYPLFAELAALDSVRLRPYQFRYTDSWQLDPGTVGEAQLPSTRAVLAVNPNNPTGTFLQTAEIKRLAATGLPLIVDEVFVDYAWDGSFERSLVGRHDGLSFILSGLSKVCGLPGLKLSWIVVQGPDEERKEALTRLERIADTYLSVGSPVQQSLPRILEAGKGVRQAIRERISENRKTLQDSGLKLLHADGGWYAILQTSRGDDEELAVHLVRDHGVLTHPGYFYDLPMEGCLVISLLPEPDILDEGLRRIREGLEGQ